MATEVTMTKEEEVLAALKEAISEARGMVKDIRREQKQLVELRDQAIEAVKEIVDLQIGTQVKEGLDKYQDTLAKAIDAGTERVYKRFDGIAAILMGEDQPHKEPIEKLVKQWRERRM